MTEMFSRSNATSPIPSLNQDIEPGQIPPGVSHFVANKEYSAQRLLEFILEARNQAKTGAFPTKIVSNYRFLDAGAAPRLTADIVAEWVALPASAIPTWIKSSARADITVRRGRLSANQSHSSVIPSPGSDLRGTGTPRSGSSIPTPGVTACQLNPWLGGDNRSGRLNASGGAAWPSGLAATLALLP